MSQATLEERVKRLEELYDDWLHGQLDRGEPGRDDWLKSVGMLGSDPVMKEIIEEGRRVREQDRQQTRTDRP
jgi:hypothetical protein